MKRSLFNLILIISSIIILISITYLLSLLPSSSQPIFRPLDLELSYKVDDEYFKYPYNKFNPPSRSFEEPDYSLLSSSQPSSYNCNNDNKPDLFIGIFSTLNHQDRRDLIRSYLNKTLDHFDTDAIKYNFIIGKPSNYREYKILNEENDIYNDISVLDVNENMNDGKTYEFYKGVVDINQHDEYFNPKFVLKCDDDTLLILPPIMRSLNELNCNDNVYWGTSAGRSHHFPHYFRGLGYALSWPLVSWIGHSDISDFHQKGIEDARTGQWLQNLNHVYPKESLINVDNEWTMGDWNQLILNEETKAMHWLKLDKWYIQQTERINRVWSFNETLNEWEFISGENEDSDNELVREAIIEKSKVREEAEKQGKEFNSDEYDKLHNINKVN